ncbi:MAG: response regulator [Lachnospiraceae bacterium]|nr:response regulator [Lachnospiraceae bacterium]
MSEKSTQKRNNHSTYIVVLTISCLGCVVESFTQGWEFWVPPIIILGMIVAWWMHLTQYNKETYRENFYLIFSMMIALFHGIHETSFFDIFVVSAMLMCVCTMLRRREYMHLFLLEFFILMCVQIWLAVVNKTMVFDSLNISRIALHFVADICVYRVLLTVIDNLNIRDREIEGLNKKNERENMYIEDFLVNLSHELRTPVNVINGMSSLILKKEYRQDVNAILTGGLRLSRQIEDIQDYSEIRRGKLILEEEPYMITSLLNDVLMNLQNLDHRNDDLELVVDLSPEVPTMMKGDVKKFHKILFHLLDNAFKFNREGGVLLCIKAIRREYGVNLVFEVTDTGVGMSKRTIEGLSNGLYQANKKRNRSTGGVGLGFALVHGFVRSMGGFVMVESKKNEGTTVRISVAQEVIDPSPCLSVAPDRYVSAAYFMVSNKFKVKAVGDFYKSMANHMAVGLRINLYFSMSVQELEKQLDKYNITHVFMGQEEYENNKNYFDILADTGLTVAVSCDPDFAVESNSRVIRLPKPLYAFPVVRVLNGTRDTAELTAVEERHRPILDDLRVLVVDDEPMNLVVATGLFKDYNMITDTAGSGMEAIEKYQSKDYDVIFMDHMMPEMDGVEAMKRLRQIAEQTHRNVRFVALTANAISGAREMFLREGFDGFISKPIDINEFERTMYSVVPHSHSQVKGGQS